MTDAVVSKNNPNISYRPLRASSRKGSHERTVGHEWTCRQCKTVVHTEPMIGFEREETAEEVSARHLRIQEACSGHECKLETPAAVAEVDGDDPDLPPEDE